MDLKTNLASETVASLPIRPAITVSPQTSLQQVVAKLRDEEIGCAIVVDSDEQPLGIFTERSLMKRLLAGVDLAKAVVVDHMSKSFAVAAQSDPISKVLELILDDGWRFVCVVDAQGQVAGLTGQRGLAEYISEHYPQQVMVQRLGGSHSMQAREGA